MRLSSLLVLTFSLVAVACTAGTDPVSTGGEANVYGTTITPGEESPEGEVGDQGDPDATGDAPMVGESESVALGDLTSIVASTTLVATGNVNLRKGPATSYDALAVIPKGAAVALLSKTPSMGYLNVQFNGQQGWAHGNYFAAGSAKSQPDGAVVPVDGAPSVANAIARAKTSVGFSYWWGFGAWLPSGSTPTIAGSCTGSCPSCSHKGSYGADCSGMIAKAWQFGTKDLKVNSHPFSTADFVTDSAGKWSTVSRANLKAADAIVYRRNGAGHIALWEKGDGWGASTVIECRGCSYGCVYNTRSFGSEYKGIRRAGF